MRKTFSSDDFGEVEVRIAKYAETGTTACRLVSTGDTDDSYPGEPIATLSVCFPEASKKLPDGYFYVKDWSENELIILVAAASGWFEPLPPDQFEPVISGFVVATHVWRVRDERGEGFNLEDCE